MYDRVHPFLFTLLSTKLLRGGTRATLLPERACQELPNDPHFAALSSLLHFAAHHALTHSAPESPSFLRYSICSSSLPRKKLFYNLDFWLEHLVILKPRLIR